MKRFVFSAKKLNDWQLLTKEESRYVVVRDSDAVIFSEHRQEKAAQRSSARLTARNTAGETFGVWRIR